MHAVVGAIAAEGVSPVIRIPSAVDWLVKRALDKGGKPESTTLAEPHSPDLTQRTPSSAP